LLKQQGQKTGVNCVIEVIRVSGRGKRLFKKDEFEEKIFDYAEYIHHNSNEIPTFYSFFQYVNRSKRCSYRTIRRCFDEYWTALKKTFRDVQADLIVNGACTGKYEPRMSIFFLKRWCGWTDKVTIQRNITAADNILDALSQSLEDENRVLRST
jgi:hypothetical protein